MAEFDYDLVVIGSGPAGQRAAIQAAKLGKRTAVIERKTVVGGVCVNTGTIPSKTLREAALYLSGYRERGIYGASYAVKQNITMSDLHYRADLVIRNEIEVVRHQLRRNGIDLIEAEASLADPHTVRLHALGESGHRDITAAFIVIAVGTMPARDPHIPFDGERVFTSDDILTLRDLPRSLAVVGAGVVGAEYATIFAALGVRVTLVDKRQDLLPFIDREIIDALAYRMRDNRMTLRFGEEVSGMELYNDERGPHVRLHLASGKQIVAEKALYSAGRNGAVERLNLAAAGVSADARGRIEVDADFRTAVDHIYAVGDAIGFPSLASTSMEQGRRAACHAFGLPCLSMPELFPFGIYTIPEISTVGRTEEELTQAGVPYEVGKASYKEIARGQIIGDSSGLLKLLFHLETRELLGITIIGEGATELVHIGQAVMAHRGRIDYFVDAVFNYPTLAECYKTAAFDGINRLG